MSSLSPDERATSTPPREKMAAGGNNQNACSRRRSRSAQDSTATRRFDSNYASERGGHRNNEYAAHSGLYGQATKGAYERPYKSPFYEVMSPRNANEHERSEAVNELLVAAGSALGKKRGNNILGPHRYVIRGNRGDKVSMDNHGRIIMGGVFRRTLTNGKRP